MSGTKYNFIDLFSGCGGFSTGMEMAGHKCLLGVDFDPAAVKSFEKNHKHAKSPITYSGHTGIQGTLAIWAHKRHCYTGKTSIYTNAMVYILMFIAKYTL